MALIDTLASRPRRMFLLDGAGALLSAIFLSGMRWLGANWFSMPPDTLLALALTALALAAYSFSIAVAQPAAWRTYLGIIASANATYGLATATLLGIHSTRLTTLDFAYFLAEILVLVGLVAIELRVLRWRN